MPQTGQWLKFVDMASCECSLFGQIMKELKGADAKVVRQMLIDELSKP
jgi:Asp-tRNA(Asn)/Glu-tRNA(Gln) amidotransferase B subunit